MTDQPLLFALPPRPRKPRRWLMHVFDAGEGLDGAEIVRFTCKRCGHETDWIRVGTVTEAKRGIVCVRCNEGSEP